MIPGIIKKAYAERTKLRSQVKAILATLNDLKDYEMAMTGENRIFYKANVLRNLKLQNTEEIVRIITAHHDELLRACGVRVKGNTEP